VSYSIDKELKEVEPTGEAKMMDSDYTRSDCNKINTLMNHERKIDRRADEW
jgi:hypothetical protein